MVEIACLDAIAIRIVIDICIYNLHGVLHSLPFLDRGRALRQKKINGGRETVVIGRVMRDYQHFTPEGG